MMRPQARFKPFRVKKFEHIYFKNSKKYSGAYGEN